MSRVALENKKASCDEQLQLCDVSEGEGIVGVGDERSFPVDIAACSNKTHRKTMRGSFLLATLKSFSALAMPRIVGIIGRDFRLIGILAVAPDVPFSVNGSVANHVDELDEPWQWHPDQRIHQGRPQIPRGQFAGLQYL